MALLNSMIIGGESHSSHSEDVVRQALDELDKRIDKVNKYKEAKKVKFSEKDFQELFATESVEK